MEIKEIERELKALRKEQKKIHQEQIKLQKQRAKQKTSLTPEQQQILTAKCDEVTLLTNDNGLAIRARECGIRTSRYGYKFPEPYTGRRDIVVPKDLLTEFFVEKRISRELFEETMPRETTLVANEFIVMRAEGEEYLLAEIPRLRRARSHADADACADPHGRYRRGRV